MIHDPTNPPKITGKQRRAIARLNGAKSTKEKIEEKKQSKWNTFFKHFGPPPDSSKDGVAQDAKSYRERAESRIKKAEERRNRRKQKRAK